MTTIYDIKKRAQQLSEKTDSETISPQEVGGLFSDLADYANDVDVNGSSLGIRKTYTSVSAMEADKNPVGDDGKPLKKGQLVNIYNQDDPSSADNNKVFSWQNPGWQIRTTLDAGYATREELTELENSQRIQNKFLLSTITPPIKSNNTIIGEINSSFPAYYKVKAKKGDVFKYKQLANFYLAIGNSYYIIINENGDELLRKDASGIDIPVNANVEYTMPEDGYISVTFTKNDIVELLTKEAGVLEGIEEINTKISEQSKKYTTTDWKVDISPVKIGDVFTITLNKYNGKNDINIFGLIDESGTEYDALFRGLRVGQSIKVVLEKEYKALRVFKGAGDDEINFTLTSYGDILDKIYANQEKNDKNIAELSQDNKDKFAKLESNIDELRNTQNKFLLSTITPPIKNNNTAPGEINSSWNAYYKVKAKKGDVFKYVQNVDFFLAVGNSYYIIINNEGKELLRKDALGLDTPIDVNTSYTMPEDGYISVTFNPLDRVELTSKQAGIIEDVENNKQSISDISKGIINITKESFLSIYKFGVIGDSLTVGYMTNPINGEKKNRNIHFSWGQILARKNGQKCLNFGFSGATATTWFTDTSNKCPELISNPDNLCQAYIIGMGTNLDTGGIGTIDDINWDNKDENALTLYGQYARIIQLIREIAPEAIIFCLTIPYPHVDTRLETNEAIRNIVKDTHISSHTFLVEMTEYNEIIKDYIAGEDKGDGIKTLNKFFYEWHYVPAGYAMMAEIYQTAISNVINNNADNNVVLSIGQTPYGNNDIIE